LGFSKNQRIIDFYIPQSYASIRLRKIIPPLIFLFCINLFSFFVLVQSVNAINIIGEWLSDSGVKLKADQEGENFSLVVVEAYYPEWVGITELKGTIAGNTFSGQYYGVSQECPNLSGYVPASGTISDEKIEVKTDSFHYNPETCVRTRDYEGSDNFTRIASPSPTPNQDEKEQTAKDENQDATVQTQQNQEAGKIPITIGGWFSRFSKIIDGLLALPEVINATVMEDKLHLGIDLPDLTFEEMFQNLNAQPVLRDRFTSLDLNRDLFNSDRIIVSETETYDVMINRKGQYVNLNPGEEIPYGSTLSVSKPVQFYFAGHAFELRPLPSQRDAVFHISKNPAENGIRIEPLNSGEVEVFKPATKESNYRAFLPVVIETQEVKVSSKKTHYSVFRNHDKKTTLVKVYEGEVELTTNGQTVSFAPDGDKPGVATVSKELSLGKLAIVSILLFATVAAAAWFIKKKNASKARKRLK